MLRYTCGYSVGMLQQYFQDRFLENRVQIVSGGFVIATYKDFPLHRDEIFESRGFRVSAKQPRKMGKVRVHSFVKWTETIVIPWGDGYYPPLSTRIYSLYFRNPSTPWDLCFQHILAEL
jgi:hypothetical protein